jgi:translocation and assembly module TamB
MLPPASEEVQMGRIGRLLLGITLVLIVGGFLAFLAHHYVLAPRATVEVTARLTAATGAPVHVERTEVGLTATGLQDVQLFEPGADKPWAEVQEVRADLGLWDLLHGRSNPHQLTLRGAVVTLHYDAEGHLLTRLPARTSQGETLPALRIEKGRFTLRQDGRPDLVVQGIDAELRPESTQLMLTGTVSDPSWGEWSLEGSIGQEMQAGQATLKTRQIHVTQERLDALPFVPAEVWRQVQAEGDTPVTFTLRWEPGAVHYRVALEPRGARFHIAAIDLDATETHGSLVVEDNVVHLKDVQGRVADGNVWLTGDLDFSHKPNELRFEVKVDRLLLHQLPKTWSLPPQIDGRLSGHAKLEVRIEADGSAHTSGDGEGVVQDARVAGLPARPIKLRLHSDGKRFHFSSPEPPQSDARGQAFPALFVFGTIYLDAPDAPPPGDAPSPLRAANRLTERLLATADGITRAGQALLAKIPRGGTPPRQPAKEASYLDANLELDDVDLAQLVHGLGNELPFPVSGRLTFKVQVSIPLDTPRDLKTYRLRGWARLPRVVLAGLEMQDAQARVTYADGILRLEQLQGRLPEGESSSPGTFEGPARLEVVPQGDLTANLTLRDIPLAQALRLVPGPAPSASGRFSGDVAVHTPAARLGDVTAWEVSGGIKADRLRAYGLTMDHFAGTVRLEHGTLSAKDVRGDLEGARVTGSGELSLTEAARYRANLDVRKADLAALQRLAPEFRPPVTIAGRFEGNADVRGTLNPPTLDASGTARADDLRVQNVAISSTTFRWDATTERLRVRDLKASVYRGDVTGSAEWPLRPEKGGSVQGRFDDVDVGNLARDVENWPFKIEGRASGTFEGTVSPADKDGTREFTSRLNVQAAQPRVQGLPTERLNGNVEYRKGKVEYRLEGETLGGRFRLEGQLPPGPSRPPPAGERRPKGVLLPPAPPDPAGVGRLTLEGARLARLWEALGVQSVLGPLQGVIDLDVTYRHEEPDRALVGSGRFTVSRLRWGLTELAGSLQGDVGLTRHELRLLNLTGSIGNGIARGAVGVNLEDIDRSWFNLTLDNVEAGRLLTPWPDLAKRFEGPVDMRLRGTFGREWNGGGDVVLNRGTVFGVEVSEWRLPVNFSFSPRSGRGQVEVQETSAQVAHGRAQGKASIGWGDNARVDGQVRFFGIDLGTLLRSFSESARVGAGRLSGRIDFGGSDVRSLNDLSATMEASFGQAEALSLPVLSQLAPFLAPGLSRSSTFQSGDLRARLARGLIHVQRLSLSGPALHLFAQGTVTLDGRLDLEVVAYTGDLGPNPRLLRLFGLRLPPIGPIPVTLIADVSSYLSNRVIHLRGTGTLRSPSVRVEPLGLLTEEAVRFFIGLLGVPALEAVPGAGPSSPELLFNRR